MKSYWNWLFQELDQKLFFLTAGDAKKAGLSVQRKQLEAHGTGQSERHPEEEKKTSQIRALVDFLRFATTVMICSAPWH